MDIDFSAIISGKVTRDILKSIAEDAIYLSKTNRASSIGKFELGQGLVGLCSVFIIDLISGKGQTAGLMRKQFNFNTFKI